MAEKVGTTKHETEGLESELDQTKTQLEAVTNECARWKGQTVELQQTLRRFKLKETQGPTQISKAVDSALLASTTTNSGQQRQPLPPSSRRVEGRVFELVNELVFDWGIPTSVVAGSWGLCLVRPWVCVMGILLRTSILKWVSITSLTSTKLL